MEVDYHNILSEEFPSPVRQHSTLPLTEEAANNERYIRTIEEQAEQPDESSLQEVPGPTPQAVEEVVRQVELQPADSSTFDVVIDPSLVDDVAPVASTSRISTPGVEERETSSKDATLAPSASTPTPATVSAPTAQDILLAGDRRKPPLRNQMTEDERKERQKAQNRKAAERSRAKRRDEVADLEVSVNEMQEENAKLRAKLSELLAVRNATPPADLEAVLNPPASAVPGGTGIDEAYHNKLQSEIHAAKQTLLEKELELAKLRGAAEPEPDVQVLRNVILAHHVTHTRLLAETTSLENIVERLHGEKEELAKQTDGMVRELETRKALKDVEGMAQEVEAMEDVVVEASDANGIVDANGGEESRVDAADKSLMDIGGWVDAAVRWQEVSDNPASQEDLPSHGTTGLGTDGLNLGV